MGVGAGAALESFCRPPVGDVSGKEEKASYSGDEVCPGVRHHVAMVERRTEPQERKTDHTERQRPSEMMKATSREQSVDRCGRRQEQDSEVDRLAAR